MDVTNRPIRSDSRTIGKPAVAVKTGKTYNSSRKIKVQSLIAAHLKFTGQVTGESYEWPIAGAIVMVNEDDVPALLARRLKRKPCCGANQVGNVFQIVI